MLRCSLLLACCAVMMLGSTTFLSAARGAEDAKPNKLRVYIGTYTTGDSKGIYICDLDLKSGELSEPVLAAESVNPSFLALHPSKRFLYAVNEVGNFGGEKTGAVSAFAVDATSGQLKLLNQQPSRGGAPCHLVVDGLGRHVLVANYTGGNVAALPIGKDGRLGKATGFVQHAGSSIDKGRQSGPHAHSINLDKSGRFAFAADLGLDKVLVYRFDSEKGTLTPHDPPAATVAPGSGPRHFAFHPSGRYTYVINEMLRTVTAFSYDAKMGVLEEIQTITTVPSDVKTGSTAEVQVHPSGRFLYGSNRGHDSLAIFRIDQKTGRLTDAGHQSTGGKTPRNFGIDPTGQFILAANQNSHTVFVFRVDPKTGALKPTDEHLHVPSPVCVRFLQ